MKFLIAIFLFSQSGVTAYAADCIVKIAGPESQFVEKYSGGCKDGMAHGQGRLAIRVMNPTTNEQMVAKISGAFLNGALNGIGKYVYSNGTWIVGNFRDGKTVDLTRVLVDKGGVQVGYVLEGGKQPHQVFTEY